MTTSPTCSYAIDESLTNRRDWRWLLAGRLARERYWWPDPTVDCHDPYLCRLILFRQGLICNAHPRASEDEYITVDPVQWAYTLYQTDLPCKQQLESMLIAGAPIETIASRLRLPVEVIDIYEMAFRDAHAETNNAKDTADDGQAVSAGC